MKQSNPNPLSRRKALAGAGVATAAAAAAVMLPAGPQAPVVEAAAPKVGSPESDAGGYRVTEHIKRYYDTARA